MGELQRFVISSDFYADEERFDWRKQPVPRLLQPNAVSMPKPATHPLDRPTDGAPQMLPSSGSYVLHLFSGPYDRIDGLGAHLRAHGIACLDRDYHPESGGGWEHNLLNDAFFEQLMTSATSGEIYAIVAGFPCSTFSVARLHPGGPPPVRSAAEPDGLTVVPDGHQRELAVANALLARFVQLVHTAVSKGASYIIENPAPRNDPSFLDGRLWDPTGLYQHHGSLWLTTSIRGLLARTQGRMVTFAMCRLGADVQKYTTLAYSRDLHDTLGQLAVMLCNHTGGHRQVGGTRAADNSWTSAEHAAWTPMLNAIMAAALAKRGVPGGANLSTVHVISAPPATVEATPAVGRPSATPSPEEPITEVDSAPAPAAPTVASPVPFRGFQATGGGMSPLPLDDALSSPPPAPAPPAAQQSAWLRNREPERHAARSMRSSTVHARAAATGGSTAVAANGSSATPLPTLEEHDGEEESTDFAEALAVLAALVARSPLPSQHFVHAREHTAALVSDMVCAMVNDTQGCDTAVVLTHTRRGEALMALDPTAARQLLVAAATHATNEDRHLTAERRPTPTSHSQAMRLDRDRWGPAELRELDNHRRNMTWVVYDRCDAEAMGMTNLLSSLWVYKNKRDGTAKARLTANGKWQELGLDYDQVFAATLRASSLRVLAALMARYGLKSNRTDFTAAYLQGELLASECVWMKMPPGHATEGRDGRERVCRVQKPIYGLKQAGRRFQRLFFDWLRAWDDGSMTQLSTDACLFHRVSRDSDGAITDMLIVGVYVDDSVSLYLRDGPGSLYHRFQTDLKREWDVEDEGELTDLINVHFASGPGWVKLHQSKYVEVLQARYIPDGVPVSFHSNQTPYTADLPRLVLSALEQNVDAVDASLRVKYQSLVGALLFAATHTRPDIAYPVNMLCRAMARPTDELYGQALLVLYYLVRHKDVGLTYEAAPTDLDAYSDSDWAVRRSTSGWVIRFQQAAISWGSKQQPSVALSSCESEIMAASEAAKDVKHKAMMADELGLELDGPTSLSVDNKAAADTAYNPEHHDKVKHIERRHFFVRELVESGVLRVPLVSTVDNIADFFTKPLAAKDFFRFRDAIMNVTSAS